MAKLINVGFGNMINTDQIVCVVNADTEHAKAAILHAQEQKRAIDITEGRKIKSIIFTNSDYLLITALQPETVMSRTNDINNTQEDS